MRVVPMGWSWTVWFIQKAVCRLLVGEDPSPPLLAQHRPCPPLDHNSVARMVYIDNFAAISLNADAAQEALDSMLRSLAEHSVAAATENPDSPLLGFSLEAAGTEWRPTDVKFWRLAFAFRELGWGRTPRTGRQICRAVGHATAVFLLRRELLSIFSHSYVFAEKWWDTPARLWASVRREFRHAWALLPLACARMTRPWSPEVFCTDASLSGLGVVRRHMNVAEVGAIGRVSERSRCRGELAASRRPRGVLEDEALVTDRLAAEATDFQLKALGRRSEFPEVPKAVAISDEWQVVASRPWRRKEHIVALEAEAALWAVRAMGRCQRGVGKRHLVLSDRCHGSAPQPKDVQLLGALFGVVVSLPACH